MTSSDSVHIDPIPRELAQQVHRQELEQTPRELCDCCDLDVRYCGKAAERKQQDELRAYRRWLIRHGWFEAKYPGDCDECGTPFKPGTLIHANGRGGLRWLAACCAPDMSEGETT